MADRRQGATKAFHRKVRTGCVTCKIRRVRCDESKPACHRCVSTGRKCDGYTQPVSSPSPSASSPSSSSSHSSSSPGTQVVQLRQQRRPPHAILAAPARQLLPQKNPDELRVYDYFVKVVAPSIAGVFDSDFWLREVPQFCLSDPAIWHAAAALSAVCRDYDFGKSPSSPSSSSVGGVFAMQQVAASLQQLTRHQSPSGIDRWRALMASILFSCLAVVQGTFSQAMVHMNSGARLFRELEDEDMQAHHGGRKRQKGAARGSPISLLSARSVVVMFQVQQSLVDPREVLGVPSIQAHDGSFTVWRTYSSPARTAVPEHVLTPDNLVRATRASESLVMSLGLFSVLYADEVRALMASGELQLPSLAAKQRGQVRCFKEIGKAITIFQEALDSAHQSFGIMGGGQPGSTAFQEQMQHALKYLRVYHLVNRIMLHRDPEEPSPIKRLLINKRLGETIVRLCEELLDAEAAGRGRGDGTYRMPSPPLTNPLSVVVQSGFGAATKRRAIALLRRPRLEGIWDTRFSASIMEAVMRQQAASRELYLEAVEREGGTPPQPIARGTGIDEVDDATFPYFRSVGMAVAFTGERSADVTIYIWRDLMDGKGGWVKQICW